ncbi:hypothetical protein B9Z55_028840 [Caenorhabditis nigoni]|uniref:Uncharacterized protein n=1 Tax=Caenorhabditis nigoni TaxID=1611254 RepID=A0A2G5SA69_9PELO|nr:hypothetical protein B9Z55_028840 [Caenorhabditis nigoni]
MKLPSIFFFSNKGARTGKLTTPGSHRGANERKIVKDEEEAEVKEAGDVENQAEGNPDEAVDGADGLIAKAAEDEAEEHLEILDVADAEVPEKFQDARRDEEEAFFMNFHSIYPKK